MIAVMAVLFITAAAVCVMMPSASAEGEDTFHTYSDIRAESYLVGVGKTIDYKIFATSDSDKDVKFIASISGGRASPSAGTVDGEGTTITITAPNDPGTYTLTVVFTFLDDNDDEIEVTKTAPLRVVVPIKLSATLVNDGDTIADMTVWFVVNGNVIEESEQQITIGARSSRSVTYDWATEGLSGGTHTVELRGEVGPIREDVRGLNDPTSFYVGQKSYTLTEALLVIIIIVLIIVLIIVIRKPVKNVGKPKARR
jgi:hypothetical protein